MTVKGCSSSCTPLTSVTASLGGVSNPADIYCCQGDNCNATEPAVETNLIANLVLAVVGIVLQQVFFI